MELYLNSYDLDNYQGRWFNFPNDTIKEVSNWFRERHIEEYGVFDFEDDILTYKEVGENPDLERLLKVSELIGEIDEEPEIVKGIVQLYKDDMEILDILESFDSLEYFTISKGDSYQSHEKIFGEYLVYEMDLFSNMTDHQKCYLDFERIGRDYLFDYYWTETKNFIILKHI
jgi:antirestriction protein